MSAKKRYKILELTNTTKDELESNLNLLSKDWRLHTIRTFFVRENINSITYSAILVFERKE